MEASKIIRDLADALDFLHHKGICCSIICVCLGEAVRMLAMAGDLLSLLWYCHLCVHSLSAGFVDYHSINLSVVFTEDNLCRPVRGAGRFDRLNE